MRVFHADSDNSASTKENVLHDNCDEWIAPEGAVDNDAKIILHLGCSKKITSFQIWNMKSEKWELNHSVFTLEIVFLGPGI